MCTDQTRLKQHRVDPDVLARVRGHGGSLVVEPFTLPGVGCGCCVIDPAGVLIILHAYDPRA